MNHDPDLKLQGLLLVDGEPVTCPSCDSATSLWLDRRGLREVAPAWLGCYSCGAGADHDVITNGLVEAALAARTGRTRATDADTFAAEWRGITITGECVPTFVLGDAVALVQELAKAGRTEAKHRGRSWWRRTKAAARGGAGQAAGAAKATALQAAWQAQTGGASPVPVPRQRCRVKGCKGGYVTIRTRIHSSSGKTREEKVPCAACHRG